MYTYVSLKYTDVSPKYTYVSPKYTYVSPKYAYASPKVNPDSILRHIWCKENFWHKIKLR